MGQSVPVEATARGARLIAALAFGTQVPTQAEYGCATAGHGARIGASVGGSGYRAVRGSVPFVHRRVHAGVRDGVAGDEARHLSIQSRVWPFSG